MPFWMTLYAEGTRFTAAKHERAEEVAKEKNYKSLQYHLQPRPTGFVTMIKKLRENKSQPVMIYDMTIQQQRNENLSMFDLLNLRPAHFTVFIKRIPLSTVPYDKEADWLRENYQEKDKRFKLILDQDFDQLMQQNGVKKQHLPVPTNSKYMAIFWMVTILPLVSYPWASWLYNSLIETGASLTTLLLIMLPVCCLLLTGAIIRTGDMKSSSSYGLKKKE